MSYMKTNCEYLPEMYWHLEPVKPPRHTQAPLSGSQNPWLSQSQKNSQLGPYFPCLHTEEQTNLITFFSDCLVIIHVLKLSIFLKATNIKSDGIKFSREKGWGAIEYKKKIDTKFLWLWFKRNFSQEILTIRAIGTLQSNRAEALPCHMITVGGATLTLLYTPRSIEPSWTHWNLNNWLLLQNPLEHAPCVGTYNQALFCSFK